MIGIATGSAPTADMNGAAIQRKPHDPQRTSDFCGGGVVIARCACGAAFDENPSFATGLCPDCDLARINAAKAEIAARERAHRVRFWPTFDLPFPDTDRARLPASKASYVLNWRPDSQKPPGLVISGETGLGKTRTVLEFLKDFYIETATPFEFCRVTEWKLRLDKAHRYGGKGVAGLVRPLCVAPIMIWDDFGHGRWNDNSLASVFEILDCRTSRRLPTILTTQKTKEELHNQFAAVNAATAQAIMRRLSEFFRLVPFVKKELADSPELALT